MFVIEFLGNSVFEKMESSTTTIAFCKSLQANILEMRPSPFTVLIADKFTFHGAYLKENVGPAVHENVGTACSP